MSNFEVFNKIIDSKDVTTGGGSASALAGAMAAGLAGMVARLSTNKEWGFLADEYEVMAEEADGTSQELLLGAEKDAQAYMLIKKAYSLPKETKEQKAIRREEIQNAGIKAATVPLQNAILCKKVYELTLLLKGKSNSNASSDLAEAELLSHAGLIGCILNIEANLPLIKDENVKKDFERQALELKMA
jgi:formiminotetrahydrofolate cyclodeaminase